MAAASKIPSESAPEPALEILSKRARGVTWRAVLLSLLLAAMFGYVVPTVDYRYSDTFLGAAHLPVGAIAVLLALLLVVNPLLKLASARAALGRNEVLTVYITCLFSVLVPGRGGENFFIPQVLSSFYYATKENKWLDFLLPYIKPWMTPALAPDGKVNSKLVADWYQGLPPNQEIPWGAWLVPLAAWTAIIFALYAMLGCLGVMVRAQWAQREALAFPLLKLPMQMTEDVDKPGAGLGSFFRSPAMWVGFSIAVFIEMLNGLHLYFPDWPEVPLGLDVGRLFTESPWNQTGQFQLRVWPLMIGISYLLTSEVSLSLWAFFLFHKLQLVVAYYIGYMPSALPEPVWTRGFSKNFIVFQQFGAIIAYGLMVLWLGREHGFHIMRRALGRARATPDESSEALSYPVAFWGFLLSWSFVIAWTSAAGVRLDIAVLLWATYLVIAIGLTRLVVEAGLIMVNTGWMALGPVSGLLGNALPPASAVPASFLSGALMFEMRGFLLPSFVQSFKLAHDRKIAARPLMALIVACISLSFGVAMWTIVKMGYQYSGLSLQDWWAKGNGAQSPVKTAEQLVRTSTQDLKLNWGWTAVGAIVTLLLMAARARYSWFPLHPIGYIIFTPFPIVTLWFSIFLGWLAKTLILKFGSTEGYRAALPAFLGLALGDVAMMIFWIAIDCWQGRTGHYLMPG